jgi:hypothetical protein
MGLLLWLKESPWGIGHSIEVEKMFRNMKPSTACDYLKACTVVSGAIVASLGILVIIGWYTIDNRLFAVLSGPAPMRINTAIGFVLSGIALVATVRGMAGVTLVCGGVAGSLGLLNPVEDLSSFEFQANRHLTGAYVDSAAAYLRRMAPSTGVCFLLAGVALVCSYRAERFWSQPPLVGLLGSIIVGTAAVTLLGHLIGLSGTYAWGEFGSMTLYTTLGFMALGVGIIALAWVAGTTEEMNSPRWLPLLIGAAGLTAATTSTLDLPTILSVLLEKTSEIFPLANAASIAFYNAETDGLEPVACRGMPPEEWKAMVTNETNTLAHRVAGAKTPISVRNLQTDAPEKPSEFGRKHGLVSYLGLPMMAKGRVLAVLSFVTKGAHEFSEEEVEFLMTLASETAAAH